MINQYSGNISRNEANRENRALNLEDIYREDKDNFQLKFENYKSLWNNYLSKEIKKNINISFYSEKFKEELNGNERLSYYLNDNDEKGYGIFIKMGYQKFIEWQNCFLQPIIDSYKNIEGKTNNILKSYIPQIKKAINIQKATKRQVLLIENCFNKKYFSSFNELLYAYFERDSINYDHFIYDFVKIEEKLAEYILPGKCLFNKEKIEYIIYQNEGYKLANYDFLYNFEKKYGALELNEEEKKKLFIYAKKEYNNFFSIYNSFILLVRYLNNNNEQKNLKIIDIIGKAEKKYMKFSDQFINFFQNEGKDIIIEKLLESILYMEYISFENLKDNINNKFKETLDKGPQEKIRKYFKTLHKDITITKCEIATALRRFITRILLNNDENENFDQSQKIYECLLRKHLWNNKIFNKDINNFDELLKKYLDLDLHFDLDFHLQVKHSYELYNIIGEEEKNLFLEEKEKFNAEAKQQNKENIKKSEQKATFVKPKKGKQAFLNGPNLKQNKAGPNLKQKK